jgi:hypothetical protein
MKKPYTLLAFVFIVALSLLPPINFYVTAPEDNKWIWMVLGAAFFGFYLMFLDVHLFVKVLSVLVFTNCFFTSVPFESFTKYITFVGCCYFYYVCQHIEDWPMIFKALQTVVFLTLFLMVMQYMGHDSLINFGYSHFVHYGIAGQHMQEASFGIIISSLLILWNPLNFLTAFAISIFCKSPWSFLCASIGLCIYLYPINPKITQKISLFFIGIFLVASTIMGKFDANININNDSGRWWVWEKSVLIANQKPFTGWGLGTYKLLFPPISKHYYKSDSMPYKTGHNFLVQLLFEMGYPFVIYVLLMVIVLLWLLIYQEKYLYVSGMVMIIMDALVHFPDRELQCILILIAFLAYIKGRHPYVRI